jgi:cytochrome c peroxidase
VCVHCHVPGDDWTITPAHVQYRFTHPMDLTNPDCLVDVSACPAVSDPSQAGLDPIFRPIDGANSPTADVSPAAARQQPYSMLLSKGVIRVGLPIPPNSEFELYAVDDPYGYASANELSLFRRPPPSTNLRLSPPDKKTTGTPILTSVMWDGRETLPGHDIIFDLMDQANGATLGHAQATAGLTAQQRQDIVDFETGLHTAQAGDNAAGDLGGMKGHGGPDWLAANQAFYPGINDAIKGDSMTGAAFDPDAFTIFAAWDGSPDPVKAQIARGEKVFDEHPIQIAGVAGLNDALGVPMIQGTCTTCHDAPNYGHHSIPLPIDIGVADGARRTPDLPLYTLRNKQTGALVTTTDPGRALVTGRWVDIGKFKGPILRGIAARAPYFHNGSAATVDDVIDFYDGRFAIGFTAQEKADLAAFLLAL